jgi:hypothetical protein
MAETQMQVENVGFSDAFVSSQESRGCHVEAGSAGQTVVTGSSVSTLDHDEDRDGAGTGIHAFCEDA